MAKSSETGSGRRRRPAAPQEARTWWHPLLTRVLDWRLKGAYRVEEVVLVGRMPAQLDVVILRRGRQPLPADVIEDLPALTSVLNQITLLEFKGPTDDLRQGDMHHLFGCAHAYCGQAEELIPHTSISLVFLAPRITRAFRQEVQSMGWNMERAQPRVHRINGPQFATWLIQTSPGRGQTGLEEPILSLFSPVLLNHPASTIAN